ncbi:MAG: ABC-type sugar/spermidine/putrescine/iron/thiamine transport system, ATPase component [Verrucomicrobiales bacterium]|nr:ABC-type sugar/spermidine/putrescine/iron/thiamine transport system, ATPase component [Verrucomicrobiales bacterium]
MAVLVLENLTKVYKTPDGRGILALKDLTLDLNATELLVLVGPSGCGKTTTLRLIAGLEDISGGQIVLHGEPLNGVPPKNRDIAMVFQSHALFPHMTVYENLSFGLKLRNLSRTEIDERIRSALETLGLSDKLNRKPDELSGGEAQRVALGRALVRQPKLFLLDEPLSNVDAPTRIQLRCEIAKLQQKLGRPMIYVTHDQKEALTLGNRIAVLNKGELQQIGTPAEIRQKPANEFVAAFFAVSP